MAQEPYTDDEWKIAFLIQANFALPTKSVLYFETANGGAHIYTVDMCKNPAKLRGWYFIVNENGQSQTFNHAIQVARYLHNQGVKVHHVQPHPI